MDTIFVSNLQSNAEWIDVATAIANIVMALATVALLLGLRWSVKQIKLSTSSQSLASLDRVYQYLDEIKPILKEIYNWKSTDMTPERVYSNDYLSEKVRKVRVTLNRIGFFVKKDAIDIDFITENFPDVFIRSFQYLEPHLEFARRQPKTKEEGPAWYRRKYFLLMIPFCQSYMRTHHPDTEYGKETIIANLVSWEMLEKDLQEWISSKQFKKHLSAYHF